MHAQGAAVRGVPCEAALPSQAQGRCGTKNRPLPACWGLWAASCPLSCPLRWRRSWPWPLGSYWENSPRCLMSRTAVSTGVDPGGGGTGSGPCCDLCVGACSCWGLSLVPPSRRAVGQQPGGDQLPPQSSEEAAAGGANGHVRAGAQGPPRGPGVPDRAETQLGYPGGWERGKKASGQSSQGVLGL